IEDKVIVKNEDIAEKFAENLAKVFTDKNQTNFEQTKIDENCTFSINEYITTREVAEAINNISNEKSAGFDDIHALFNYSVKLGHIPNEWKKAKSGLKLKELGLSPTFLRWIKNFLSERAFHVQYNGCRSSEQHIESGVPQGSCLSPTIFILFFSAIADCIPENIKKALFADDLCAWITANSKKELEKNLQKAIDNLVQICKTWGFTINSEKTNYTTFTTGGRRKIQAKSINR
ncbi:unnamed protein product, partial [Brachionus calyciflorus]